MKKLLTLTAFSLFVSTSVLSSDCVGEYELIASESSNSCDTELVVQKLPLVNDNVKVGEVLITNSRWSNKLENYQSYLADFSEVLGVTSKISHGDDHDISFTGNIKLNSSKLKYKANIGGHQKIVGTKKVKCDSEGLSYTSKMKAQILLFIYDEIESSTCSYKRLSVNSN